MIDYIDPAIAWPLALVLCVIWRRQVVVARRAAKPTEQESL